MDVGWIIPMGVIAQLRTNMIRGRRVEALYVLAAILHLRNGPRLA